MERGKVLSRLQYILTFVIDLLDNPDIEINTGKKIYPDSPYKLLYLEVENNCLTLVDELIDHR